MRKLIVWIPIIGLIAVIVDSFIHKSWNDPLFGKMWFNDSILLAGINSTMHAFSCGLFIMYWL